MHTIPHHLYLSGTEIDSHPVEVALRSVLEHLNSSPDAFFTLEYAGGFFQGHRVENNTYRVEFAVLSDEPEQNHQLVCREPITGVQLCGMYVDVLSGETSWRDSVEWDVMEFSPDEDQEVFLGTFEPREVHPLMEALHAEGIEVRMEQSFRGYDLIVTAGALEATNAVVQRTLRLEV